MGRGIAFPGTDVPGSSGRGAGAFFRAWRLAKQASLIQWATLLVPPERYGISVADMVAYLDHFEQTDEWGAPQPFETICELLKSLRERVCPGSDTDLLRLDTLGRIVFPTCKGRA